jgi:hypothetical protein
MSHQAASDTGRFASFLDSISINLNGMASRGLPKRYEEHHGFSINKLIAPVGGNVIT